MGGKSRNWWQRERREGWIGGQENGMEESISLWLFNMAGRGHREGEHEDVGRGGGIPSPRRTGPCLQLPPAGCSLPLAYHVGCGSCPLPPWISRPWFVHPFLISQHIWVIRYVKTNKSPLMLNFLEKSPGRYHFGELHIVPQQAKVAHFSSLIGRDCCFLENLMKRVTRT